MGLALLFWIAALILAVAWNAAAAHRYEAMRLRCLTDLKALKRESNEIQDELRALRFIVGRSRHEGKN